MNGWLLDTNVISALTQENGAPSVKVWAALQTEQEFFISILSLAEYDKGIENLSPGDARRSLYTTSRDAVENRFGTRMLSLDDQIVRLWGSITGKVRRKTGHPPPVVDTLIAATALRHDLCLVTRNVKDVVETGAMFFNPWSPGDR